MTTKNNFKDWLEAEDQARFHGRLGRLKFAVEQYGEPRHQLMTGGMIGYRAFEEARWCFVNGQFIACVVLTQMVLEHMLAGLFRIAGRDDIADAGFRRLLEEAQTESFISSVEFDKFEGLRKLRNPYSHSRRPLADDSIEMRMLKANAPYEEIVENDASEALQMLFSILQRKPFSFRTGD